MVRLLTIYRQAPSPTNREKLQTHMDKHPMALVILSPEDLHFLKTCEFKV